MQSGVQYLINEPLLLALNLHRRWWVLSLSRIRIIGCRFQEGDVKDWVDMHILMEPEAVGVCRDLLGNLKRAVTLIVQLTGWTPSLPIPGIKPDLVSDLIIRGRYAVLVGVVLISHLGP
jgi:hypothetical protein